MECVCSPPCVRMHTGLIVIFWWVWVAFWYWVVIDTGLCLAVCPPCPRPPHMASDCRIGHSAFPGQRLLEATKPVFTCCVIVSLYYWWMLALILLDLASSLLDQEIGWEECLWNELFCVEWDVKPYLKVKALSSVTEITPWTCVLLSSIY